MKEINVKVPEWMDEDFFKLQVERIITLEKKKRELIEKTVEKLDLNENDLKDLEKVREQVWREEKKKLGL
ncbi:MAG: hypothetical protein ACLFVX_09105 [Archaeoglobaceae archaeon]